MLGRQEREQLEFFICGSLRDLVPDDHVLARVDRVLDLAWLARRSPISMRSAPAARDRPGGAVRLMLAGFLLGIVHDRRLMREAQVNLAIRWFAGFGLHDRLPDHSSLTRIRQRWGAERFRQHLRADGAGLRGKAGIAKGEVVHVDASLIRADVELGEPGGAPCRRRGRGEWRCGGKRDEQPGREEDRKYKKVCLTDPDASMATSGRNRRLEPSYKQQGVDDDLRRRARRRGHDR